MDFRTLAREIALGGPNLTVTEVLNLTEYLLPLFPAEVPLDNSDPEALGRHALTLYKVVDAASRDRKIEAIKELRAATSCGLKEAKDAIESKAFTSVHTIMAPRPWLGSSQTW
jgi:hypothetical protein